MITQNTTLGPRYTFTLPDVPAPQRVPPPIAPMPPTAPGLNDALPPPVATTAQWVNAQFATRPTLRSVAAGVLSDAIKQLAPNLILDLAQASVSQATADSPPQTRSTPLLEVALRYLSGGELDFNDATFTPPLSDQDTQNVELAIRSLPQLIPPAFQQSLADYWGQPGTGAGQAGSRWLGLSNTLKDTLRTAALTQPQLTDAQRQTLDQVLTWPDSAQRRQAIGDDMAKVFVRGDGAGRYSPDLLITRQVNGQTLVLHATPAGVITPYPGLETFDKAGGERQEPDANVFDIQAGLLLNQLLENVASIPLPGAGPQHALETQFARAGNPAPWFVDAYTPTAEQMHATLPSWLSQAPPAERLAYHTHTLELASSVQRNQGRSALTGIADIREFTRQQLQAPLQRLGLNIDHLQVTFKVPVGDLGSGYIERVSMTLTDMALRNLAGLPKGDMEIHHDGQLLSDPELPQQLKQIITQVDIGSTYPALLQRQLLDDTPATRERRTLFAEQVPIQLAMQALEFKLKGECGISERGYRYLDAVLSPGAGDKMVDQQAIVVRPLAFLRKPDAAPDVVTSMYVIEPQDAANGPHLLYRPLQAPPLLEFATRQALLEAVQAPGALQRSVLAWLPDDKARAVYGNGGFNTPNIAHYYTTNEFDAPATPAPTALAVEGYAAADSLARDLREGRLMQHLYDANAHSLVNLAQGQSVSNVQNRWASYKEFGWLLFNSVLPVLRGPGAMVGWLLQLANTDAQINKLSSQGSQDASAATVDLLVNVALLLAHATPARAPESTAPLERFEPIQPSPSSPGVVHRAAPGTGSGGILDQPTLLDFGFSSPRALTPAQRALIEPFKVPAPVDVGTPIAQGSQKGLYRVDDKLYVHIDSQWFRVAQDPDGVYVVDQNNKARTGPPLTRGAQQQWVFDTRPRLRGGMRKHSSVAAQLKKNVQIQQQMKARRDQSIIEHAQAFSARSTLRLEAQDQLIDYEAARKKLHTLWKLDNQETQSGRFTAQYQAQLHITQELRARLEQQMVELGQLTQTVSAALQTQIETLNPKKLGGLDDTSEQKRTRSIDYGGMFNIHRDIENIRIRLVNNSTEFGLDGALMTQLLRSAATGSTQAYNQLQESLKASYQDRENLRTAAEATQAALEKWRNDSPFGNKKAEEHLQSQTAWPPARNILQMKLGVLSHLKELSLVRYTQAADASEQFFLQRFKDNQLKSVSNTYMEQQQYSGYTLAERKAILQTVIDAFKGSLNDSTSLNESNPAFFREEYRQRLAERLGEVINDAQAQLAEVIREEQALSPAQPKRAEQQRKPLNQRVFKTRDKQTLIGTLRPAQSGDSNQIIDVLDMQTGVPIASYSEHPAEHEWVRIVSGQAAPTPPATPSPKSMASYRAESQRLIEEGAAIERTILFQKKKLDDPLRRQNVNPLDWNDMLETQAKKLEQTARRAADAHGTVPAAAEQIKQWQSAAAQMLKQARQHCADGYKALPPKPENIDFLWQHGFVDINLVQRDVPTKSGDVFTEYAVRDKGKVDVLWYAHFHYPAKGSARNLYTAAHLKIPAQRAKTQKDLVAEAGNNRIVEQITRARIGPPLDEKLFLKL
ncbi:dermonecrotic toxin domain-containing protein [Pseudomonas sp.]|uniref:dermonecrotic toxin domain-containing protein n=1 Tax=Pseudomonas sp. TaxID=306 RepID=UPI003C3E6739